MKKYILSFWVLGFCFVWSCRSKEILNPNPAVPIENEATLLKKIFVKGASDIKIDHENEIVQITLSESYTSEFIDLDFTLAKGVFLSYIDFEGSQKSISNTSSLEYQTHRFTYAGTRPLRIYVQKEFGLNIKSYLIYVNQINKKLQTEIEKIDSVYSYSDSPVKFVSVANFYLKIINPNGTFPNNPNNKNNFVLLKMDSQVDTIFLGDGQTQFGFNVEKFVPFEDKKFSLEFVSDNSRQILKENFTFVRQKPQAYYNPFGVFEMEKSFKVTGGIFLSNNQYKFRFFNDFLKNNIVLDARYDDAHYLSVPSLSLLPVGSYIVEILENGTVLSTGVINIGKTVNASAIRAIKRGENNISGEDHSTKKEQLNQGETFSILPEYFFSSCYGGIGISQETLDNIEAPSLKLSNGLQEITLSPKKIIIRWGVAACNVVYFQYTIPKSTESGFYEAQLVYPDGRESLKYWNKIEIR